MYDIVIPTYGIKGANMVSSLVESISMFDNKSLSNIIISDDGSDIDTLLKLDDIRNEYKNNFIIKLIFNERLNSFSKTVNAGMKLSNSNLNNDILLLNNDMLALTSFEPFVDFIKIKNNIGIISGKLLYSYGKVQSVGTVYNRLINSFRNIHQNKDYTHKDVNYPKKYIALIGACQYINRELINKIGYYDENYLFSMEDIDYCVNANYNNYETWYIPDVVMTHYASMSINNNQHIKNQNKQYFWKKWNSLYHTISTNQGISDDDLDVKVVTVSCLTGLCLIFR